jgi:parallel beta-helix repeat protein
VLVNGYFELTGNLNCDEDPAITVVGPAKLNLKGKILSGVPVPCEGKNDCPCEDENNCILNDCIRIEGGGAWVWNGTVTNCVDGMVIAGTGRHKVSRIRSMDNTNTGFKVEEEINGNWLANNEAIGNSKENFLIEEESDGNHLIYNKAEDGDDRGYYVRGSSNRLYKNKANGNFDDALRIRNLNKHRVIHNNFNGTESG